MSNRNFLLKGTLLLTLSGFLTKNHRLYFYKIFLSQKIGAQGMEFIIYFSRLHPYAMRLQQEAYRQLFSIS